MNVDSWLWPPLLCWYLHFVRPTIVSVVRVSDILLWFYIKVICSIWFHNIIGMINEFLQSWPSFTHELGILQTGLNSHQQKHPTCDWQELAFKVSVLFIFRQNNTEACALLELPESFPMVMNSIYSWEFWPLTHSLLISSLFIYLFNWCSFLRTSIELLTFTT